LIAKGSYDKATADVQAKLAEQLAQLGGRTETVLILRESLFRLCELAINNPALPPDELKGLYKEVIDAVVQLAKADVTNAQAAETKAKAALEGAKTLQMKTFESLDSDVRKRIGNIEQKDSRFAALKPRLLKCTTFAIANMAASQKNYLPAKVLTLPRLENENRGVDIHLDLGRKNLYYRAKI
jgi:hypothetical protein